MDNISEVFANDQLSVADTSMNQTMERIQKYKRTSKNKILYGIVITVLLIFMASAGLFVLKYYQKNEIVCKESQYIDQTQHFCLNCDPSCERCQTGG